MPSDFHVSIDNEMDSESLETLLGTSQGPDCLKELVPKLCLRVKLYQRIKTLFYTRVAISDCSNCFSLYSPATSFLSLLISSLVLPALKQLSPLEAVDSYKVINQNYEKIYMYFIATASHTS